MALSVAAAALHVSSTSMMGTRSSTGITNGFANGLTSTIDKNTTFIGDSFRFEGDQLRPFRCWFRALPGEREQRDRRNSLQTSCLRWRARRRSAESAGLLKDPAD